jgi:hypothetical protein
MSNDHFDSRVETMASSANTSVSNINITEKPRRRENFTHEEQIALAQAVKDRYDALFGPFSSSVTRHSKTKMWMDVADAVNAVGGNHRTVEEIKTKHKNLKTAAKKIESSNRREFFKTGGGTAIINDLSDAEKIIIETIPEALIVGIQGGIDLHEKPIGKNTR